MKPLLIIAIIIAAGCNSFSESANEIQSFIPGTYVMPFEGEYFRRGEDTLIISMLNADANIYAITRHISYEKIIDRQVQPREYKTENWIGIYNNEDKILHEQKHGKLISFIPGKNELLLGNSEYKKIK